MGIALSAAAAVSAVGVAHAAEASWLSFPNNPLFEFSDIAPGQSGSATFTVTNPQSAPVKFSLRVIDLDNDDNGCVEPEAAAGDTTCGRGGGELQFDLMLSLESTAGQQLFLATRTLDAWSSSATADPLALAGHEARTYRLGYQLPIGSTNITQSDLVSFALEMRLEQETEDTVVVEAPLVIRGTPPLPSTGADIGIITAIGMVTALAGITLYRWTTHRRRST